MDNHMINIDITIYMCNVYMYVKAVNQFILTRKMVPITRRASSVLESI